MDREDHCPPSSLPSRYLVRELDRIPSALPHSCAIVGAGRLGHALATALRDAGIEVEGPFGRAADPRAEVVLLCVPDQEIAAAAAGLTPRNALAGHCSGATPLEPLHPHEAFSLHPLMTVPEGATATFEGAGCAVAGTTERARRTAEALARALRMRPVEVEDQDRAAYHAAASIAANFLVTLEGAAERLPAPGRVPRRLLGPPPPAPPGKRG